MKDNQLKNTVKLFLISITLLDPRYLWSLGTVGTLHICTLTWFRVNCRRKMSCFTNISLKTGYYLLIFYQCSNIIYIYIFFFTNYVPRKKISFKCKIELDHKYPYSVYNTSCISIVVKVCSTETVAHRFKSQPSQPIHFCLVNLKFVRTS